jgi:nucleotide-binding universal stress UspA family protein
MTKTEKAMLPLKEQESIAILPRYQSIFIAADASDHSNRGVADAAKLGNLWQSTITGAHVYAAKMHDARFRQMEGGLPEQYQEETELEKQRDIHDTLITKGLSAITDSYLDQIEQTCHQQQLSYRRCALEGKNYRELVNEANNGYYDLLVMGSLGLGAVASSRIGSVCERVARRNGIDSLIIKDPTRSISDGPIVVAIDGSTRAYAGLLIGLSLAKAWDRPLKVISAFDPYFHYVAFNRIAEVLSEEAGKIFRFKEQEQLHEDIIDSGLAKIYQGHLDVAKEIAKEQGVEITTTLLDGKPYEAIEKYLQEPSAGLEKESSAGQNKERNPSLLIVGKLGIHADDYLDIGGTAENLLRNISCSVWLCQRHYQPRIDMIAEASCSWTKQAKQRINNVPEFVRAMARLGVLRYAQKQGHTVITDRIVQEATKNLCPARINKTKDDGKKEQIVDAVKSLKKFRPDWSAQAKVIANNISEPSLRDNVMKRAEKKARQAGCMTVQPQHINCLIHSKKLESGNFSQDSNRGKSKATDDGNCANKNDEQTNKCPFGFKPEQHESQPLPWSEAALQRLQQVPMGYMRDMTRKRVESFARKRGQAEVTEDVMNDKYQQWAQGSSKQEITMSWSASALKKIERIPGFVRGMVIREVECYALDQGVGEITPELISKASDSWAGNGSFHGETGSAPNKDL